MVPDFMPALKHGAGGGRQTTDIQAALEKRSGNIASGKDIKQRERPFAGTIVESKCDCGAEARTLIHGRAEKL
jgi:hypothetical protein